MKFSIIVPVYKVEDYLGQCIESVINQDYDDFELILVDDGSPDNCSKLCDDFAVKYEKIKVIHKENGGLSDARNAGIKLAKGDYLCFVDGDDYWDDVSALTKLAKVLSDTEAYVVQYGLRKYWQAEDRYEKLPQRQLSHLNGVCAGESLEKLVSTGMLSVSACSMSVSRRFLLENNLLFKKGIKSEDIEWAFRLFSVCSKIAFLDESFYIYRQQREGSITNTVDYKHLYDCCDILEDSILKIKECSNEIKKPLMSFLMYQLLTVIGLAYYVDLDKLQRSKIINRTKAIATEHLSENTLNPKVKLASRVYRMFGFSAMARVLGFYLKHR